MLKISLNVFVCTIMFCQCASAAYTLTKFLSCPVIALLFVSEFLLYGCFTDAQEINALDIDALDNNNNNNFF